jgi:hypothetical protein
MTDKHNAAEIKMVEQAGKIVCESVGIIPADWTV